MASPINADSSPQRFLEWQFPCWKYNNQTVMIPPVFTPSKRGLTISREGKYRHQDDVNISGIIGEGLVHARLQQIGQANKLGMFVIHDFQIENITNWNKTCVDRPKDQVPQPPKSTGQSDFVIFHHKKGVILVEVKNIKETSADVAQKLLWTKTDGDETAEQKQSQKPLTGVAETTEASSSTEENLLPLENDSQTPTSKVTSQEVKGLAKLNKEIRDAKKQLKRSREIVEALAKSLSNSEEASEPLPVRIVIALPSTKKGTVRTQPDDPLFIYQEDLRSAESFWCWWNEKIEAALSMATAVDTNKAYELALSRVVAVRHMGPVSQSEYTAEISHTLETFKHLENLAEHYWTVRETEFCNLFRWCQDMFQATEFYSELPTAKVLQNTCLDALQSLNIAAEKGNLLKKLNKHLSGKRFLWGEKPTDGDEKVFQYLSVKYIMDMGSIVSYMSRVSGTPKNAILPASNTTLKDLYLDDTDNIQCLNELSKRLAKHQTHFLEGEYCTYLDVELYTNLAEGDIRVRPLPGKRPWAPVFTAEQLAIFEGPKKQLIIGGPGSGKTELMRSKALLLSQENRGQQRILYLIQLPEKSEAVFPNIMEEYFKHNKANVDVKTVQLEGENGKKFEDQCSKINVQAYNHVFIDELWIGSKNRFQLNTNPVDELSIVKEAIENVKGYVWMSSVFDYKEESFEDEKSREDIDQLLMRQKLQGTENPLYKTLGTPSLLKTLKKNGGVVTRMKHLLRSTNNIVKLLQDYSARYSDRDFPYGTDKMLNHNVEGQEISWIAVQPQDRQEQKSHQGDQAPRKELVGLMYKECAKVIHKALHTDDSTSTLRPTSLMEAKKLQLQPGDILIVNFAARYQTNNDLGDELHGIPVHELTKEKVSADYPTWFRRKVCLVNSNSRFDSTLIDGTEWPMVVILLTSELLFTTDVKVPFQVLRNYDTYIAMFRAQAKLVVISDSWRSSQDFLKVVDEKDK